MHLDTDIKENSARGTAVTDPVCGMTVCPLPKDRTIAVAWGSGYRSSVSSSLLASRGYKNIANVFGGMSAWKLAGLPTTRK